MRRVNIKPTVSIICLTFNQEKYVRDCFEGFVMQQTNFPFEVLVYDDASKDGTPAIIREYAAKYPDLFKPTLYEKNNYSQGFGYVGLYTGINEAQGKYVAYCEGDDYWTDEHKLQKQVDFLETHPDYEVCAHETIIRNDRDQSVDGLRFSEFNKNKFVSTSKQYYTFDDALCGNIFHISSMMYRNYSIKLPNWLPSISAGDMVLYMLLAHEGGMYVMKDQMSVYRDHSDSLTNLFTEYQSVINFYALSIKVLRLMNRYWNRQYQEKIYPLIARYYVECAMVYLRKTNRNTSMFRKAIKAASMYSKQTAIKYLTMGLAEKLKNGIGRLLPLAYYYKIKNNIKFYFFKKRLVREDAATKREIVKKIMSLPDGMLGDKIGQDDIVLSLTSYGKRVESSLPYVLYSLLTQTVMPKKIAVYLDYDHWNDEVLPTLLQKLKKVGVDFYYCEDIRSYKKLIPALEMFPNNPIVTLDDDFYYNPNYMQWMTDAYMASDKKTILGQWGCKPEKQEGKYIPYNQWKDGQYDVIDSDISFYGCCCCYPPYVFDGEILKRELFTKLCPTADDIWFWAMEERQHIKRRYITPSGYGYNKPVDRIYDYDIAGDGCLTVINGLGGANDVQFRKVVDYYHLEDEL